MSVPALRIIKIMAVDPSSIRMKPKELKKNTFGLCLYNLYEWAENKHFVSLKLECKSGVRTRDLWLFKQAALTGAPGSPPESVFNSSNLKTA